MEAVAKLRNAPMPPRKMRMVADMIRGQKVSKALNILKFEPRNGAPYLEKLLLSAISNWEAHNPETDAEKADLYVKTIFVDGGATIKRMRPAPQGRGYKIRKRSNHVTLVVDATPQKPQQAAIIETKTEESNG